MRNKSTLILLNLLVLLLFIQKVTSLIDPISIGVAGAVGALFYNYNTVKDNTYCRFAECCTDNYIPEDINGLTRDLKFNLFGQHIVINQIIPALSSHLKSRDHSKKPLVISFHGTPGTGKNYVADFIAKNMYKNGLNSEYVHKFLGRSDFSLQSQINSYKEIVHTKIREAVRKCPRSLFIFDEVEKMPPGIFDTIKSILDHHWQLDGVSYRSAIFIFLSNTAGVEIAHHLGNLMKQGVWRGDTTAQDFEKILEVAAYNLEGGLQKASIIESHLIDHYIPFLPLEKKHVEECIIAEYMRLRCHSYTKDSVKKIIDNFITFDKASGLFATSGCKRISKKVEFDVYAMRGNI